MRERVRVTLVTTRAGWMSLISILPRTRSRSTAEGGFTVWRGFTKEPLRDMEAEHIGGAP